MGYDHLTERCITLAYDRIMGGDCGVVQWKKICSAEIRSIVTGWEMEICHGLTGGLDETPEMSSLLTGLSWALI